MAETIEPRGGSLLGGRGWLVAVTAIAIVSFLPWYTVRSSYGSLYAGSGVRVNSADVWLASTWWSAALALAATAFVLRFWAGRMSSRRGRMTAVVPALAVAALVALGVQWWDVVAPQGKGSFIGTNVPPEQVVHPDLSVQAIAPIDRNALHWESGPDYSSGPTWIADLVSIGVATSCIWLVWSARSVPADRLTQDPGQEQ